MSRPFLVIISALKLNSKLFNLQNLYLKQKLFEAVSQSHMYCSQKGKTYQHATI